MSSLDKKSNFEQYEAIRRKTDDEYESAISAFGLSKSCMMIIFTLYSLGRPCTQKEICDDWYENKQTINSAAKKLEEEGIIDMASSPENLREKLLVFTEKGKFLAMRTVGKLIFAEKSAFAKLSEDEQQTAICLSEKFHGYLKEEFEKVKGEDK